MVYFRSAQGDNAHQFRGKYSELH